MLIVILRLIITGTLPVLLSVLFYTAEKKDKFANVSYKKKQAIIGASYGILAILSTEFGIPMDGAIVNVRNAAPLTAGLIFGAPAGIIAGLIGGIERWFSTYWGTGEFTQMACTIATIMSGFIAAVVRQFMTDNKKASWMYGLAVGMTSEVLHMLLVFLTNPNEIHRGFLIVQKCAVVMITANALSVMASILVLSYLARDTKKEKRDTHSISQIFQKLLFISVVLAFLVTNIFTNRFETKLSEVTTEITLRTNLEDVENDIQYASDESMLHLAKDVAGKLPEMITNDILQIWADIYNISEINYIDQNGIIIYSTNEDFIGYDMAGGEQSGEFLVLLDGATELVQDYQPTTLEPELSRKYAGVALNNGCILQVGYDALNFQQNIDEQVVKAAKNRHIGRTGFIIICTEQGVIVSDRDGHENENISLLGTANNNNLKEWEQFKETVYGEESYCMYTESEGYYIIAVLPKEEALFSRDVSNYILAFMEILVFAALFAHVYFLIKKIVVDNIHKINESLSQITEGNLDEIVDVHSNEEFALLSEDINITVATLKHYINEAKARIDKELEVAKKIQSSMLPSVFPPYPSRTEFEIFASMDAAKEVGGDFYDFYLLDDNHLAFLIADVSGKGIPAAMFMMTAKTLIKSYAESGLEVHEVFEHTNKELCANNDASMFVTAWMGILDLKSGVLNYTNAGHNPPLLRHADGTFEYVKTKANFVLAGMDGIPYRKGELFLKPGDEFYLYTDGVTEAHNLQKELFGEDRLRKSLNENVSLTVQEKCKKVKQDMDLFTGEAEQFDDITMLCLKYNGEETTC